MSDSKKTPVKVKGESLTKTYTLAKPIIYFGVDKGPGDEVLLTDQQAEQLRESGHIVSTGE